MMAFGTYPIIQVETFQNEFKLTATAINSSHGGCKPEILEVQIINSSPIDANNNDRKLWVENGRWS